MFTVNITLGIVIFLVATMVFASLVDVFGWQDAKFKSFLLYLGVVAVFNIFGVSIVEILVDHFGGNSEGIDAAYNAAATIVVLSALCQKDIFADVTEKIRSPFFK